MSLVNIYYLTIECNLLYIDRLNIFLGEAAKPPSKTRPRVHKEIENEDRAQDQIDKFP